MDALVPPVPRSLERRLQEAPSPQRAFAWNLEKWLPVVADADDVRAVLRQLPERLSRDDVRHVVQEQLANRQTLAAFVPVMIWGGPGGYGPFRTRAILTGSRSPGNWSAPIDESVARRLLAAARVVQQADPVEAFRLLNNEGHIKYLGGAFFTKWMSFASATAGTDTEEVAPILDKRVRDWIEINTRDTGGISLSTTSTADYARYLSVLDAWRRGNHGKRTRVQVELAIFDLSRDRPDIGLAPPLKQPN